MASGCRRLPAPRGRPASSGPVRGRHSTARHGTARPGGSRPHPAAPAPGGRPPAQAPLLTDFKAERKRPSGPERRRARAAATSGGESSRSGTNARGGGEGRAPPRPERTIPLRQREDGGTKGQGEGGRASPGPPGSSAAGPAPRTHRHLPVLCLRCSPFPASGGARPLPLPGSERVRSPSPPPS